MAKARGLLAAQLRNLLQQRNWTQAELAKGIGKSQPLVSQVIKGTRGISIDTLDAMSAFFSIPVAGLFADLSKPDSEPLALTPEERHLIEGFRRAHVKDRTAIRVLLDMPAANANVDPQTTTEELYERLANIAQAVQGLSLPVSQRQRDNDPRTGQ
jgi:transcriptional regulator with XRE-family HTH domain